jgi:adenine-specific DNA-methyltransferase
MSIGESEVANLKLLSDEIYGENNFISYVARVAKTASNKGNYFAPSIDFILVYAKNISSLPLFKDEVNVDLYKKKDKKGFYRDDVALYQSSLDIRPNQRYFIECPDGSLVIPPGNVFPRKKKDAAFIKPETSADRVWRWSYPTYLEKKDLLVFKGTKRSPLLDQNGKPAKWNIYTKSYLDERSEVGTVPRNFLDQFINRKGADFLKTIDIDFNYSKPVELIKYLIRIANKSLDITVLDFMAGSGTTGQAVLEMNKNDNGKRSFILCTNNELNDVSDDSVKKDQKANKEEFGLCRRVTIPRLERIIKGYKDFEPLGSNLKYFKTAFVKKNINQDQNKINITNKCTEMLCLKEGIFDLIKEKDDYRIFSKNGRIMAVYYSFLNDSIKELKKNLDKMGGKKILYCFTLDSFGLNKDNFIGWNDVILESIPQKILDIYEEIYEY